MTEQIRKFIDYGIDPPPVEVAPPPNEKFASVPQRAQVRNPATMLRRCRMKKFRHVVANHLRPRRESPAPQDRLLSEVRLGVFLVRDQG